MCPHVGAGPAPPARDEEAVAALVLAVAGFLAVPVIPSVMAIRFGLAVRSRARATPGLRGRWMGTAAVVLGIVELALAVAVIVGLVWFPTMVPGG
jgi:Domain of unknown function (DUF4190)